MASVLRSIQSKALAKKYRPNKKFKLEIDGAPGDLDYYVVDMSHTPIESATTEITYGFKKMTFPDQSQPVELTVTFRDSDDEKITDWLKDWHSKIDNGDGTMNPPSRFLKKGKRYIVEDAGSCGSSSYVETLKDEWMMFPFRVGEKTETREEGGPLTFPVSFMTFRS